MFYNIEKKKKNKSHLQQQTIFLAYLEENPHTSIRAVATGLFKSSVYKMVKQNRYPYKMIKGFMYN